MKSTLTDWISSLKKHLIRKWIEPPKPLSPCLTTVWGILQAISGKPEIWQKSFRDASPGFYGQVAKPTLAWGYPAWATWLGLPGFVWPNRNFLWCHAAPLIGFVFMNLAIASKSGTFCFGVTPRKWVIMVPTPGILPRPPGWESKHSLFIQNRNAEIKSTACIQNW